MNKIISLDFLDTVDANATVCELVDVVAPCADTETCIEVNATAVCVYVFLYIMLSCPK